MTRMLVAVDGSRRSTEVLKWALDHANPEDQVVVTLVWNLSSVAGFENPFANLNDARLKAVKRVNTLIDRVSRERWAAHHRSIPVRVDVRHGDPVNELVRLSTDVDMIVIGGFQQGLASLGSVAKGVASQAKCAVTLVPLADTVVERRGAKSPGRIPA